MTNDPVLTKALHDLASELKGIAQSTSASLESLQKELAELKDSRFKPYMTSMGLFLVIVIGVMSYVYQMEVKFTSAVFKLNDRIQEVNTASHRNGDSIDNLTLRLEARAKVTAGFIDRANRRLERIDGELSASSKAQGALRHGETQY